MALAMERIETGAKTRRYRATVNSVFLVTEGAGESMIGERRFSWHRGDTFVAPTLTGIEHRAHADATLFTLTDEPLMRFCNYYRFEAD